MVKADGYGLGSALVAETLAKAGATTFFVATAFAMEGENMEECEETKKWAEEMIGIKSNAIYKLFVNILMYHVSSSDS